MLMSTRVLMVAVLFFSVVIFQYYSSFIVSSLLIDPPKSIKTVQNLLDSDLKCYIDDVAYLRDHIDRYNDSTVNKMNTVIKSRPDGYVTFEHGVDLIKSGGHAVFTDGNHMYPILKGNIPRM